MRAFAVLLCLIAAAPIQAQINSPLAQVPANAAVVIHVRGVQRNKDRLLAMLGNVMKGREGQRMLSDIEDKYNDAVNGRLVPGRSLKGLTADASIFLALGALPDNVNELGDALLLIVPVKSYADFRDGLLSEGERKELELRDGYETTSIMGKQVFFIERKGYAVVTLRRDLANQFKKAQPGLDKKLDAASVKHLLEGDVALYVDTVAIGKKYAEQLLEFRQTVLQKMLDEQGPLGGSPEMREAMKVLMREFTKVLKDSRAIVVSAQMEPEGLKLHAHMSFGRDTNTAAFLKSQKLTPLDVIGQLPSTQRCFTAVIPAGSEKGGSPFAEAMQRIFANRKGIAESEKLAEEAGTALELTADQDRMSLDGIEIKECKNPDKMVASMLKFYESGKEGDPASGNLLLAEKPNVATDAQKHRGFSFHRVRLVYDLAKSAEAQRVTMAFLRGQIGGDESQFWFGTDGKSFVTLKSKTWDGAQKHLDSYLDRGANLLVNSAGFRKARKQLPENVSFLMIEETSVYTQIMLDAEAQRFLPKAPRPRPGDEAYWGFSISMSGEHMAMDAWVPTRIFNDYFKALGVSP